MAISSSDHPRFLPAPDSGGSSREHYLIQIDQGHVNAANIIHEFAHCIDWAMSGSAAFSNEGCKIREYACKRNEAFADAMALKFLSEQGNDLRATGWYGTEASIPDPDTVTPQWLINHLQTP